MPKDHELHALKRLLKLSILLQSDLITPDGICQILGMGLFSNEVCENTIFEISQESTCEVTGSFGPHLGLKATHLVLPLDQNSPVGAAMILEKTLWIARSKQLVAEFPESINLPYFEQIQTVIATPIVLLGSVIGCLVIACKERESTPNQVATLELIASFIATQLKRSELTCYQKLIKRAIKRTPSYRPRKTHSRDDVAWTLEQRMLDQPRIQRIDNSPRCRINVCKTSRNQSQTSRRTFQQFLVCTYLVLIVQVKIVNLRLLITMREEEEMPSKGSMRISLKNSHPVYVLALLLVALPFLSVSALGVRFQIAESQSMEPKIEDGDAIISREVEFYDLNVGAVIVLLNEQTLQKQVHRITDIRHQNDLSIFITTKGDANKFSDGEQEYLPQQRVQLVAFVIPKLGYLTNSLSPRISLLMLVFACVVTAVSLLRFKKRRTQANI